MGERLFFQLLPRYLLTLPSSSSRFSIVFSWMTISPFESINPFLCSIFLDPSLSYDSRVFGAV